MGAGGAGDAEGKARSVRTQAKNFFVQSQAVGLGAPRKPLSMPVYSGLEYQLGLVRDHEGSSGLTLGLRLRWSGLGAWLCLAPGCGDLPGSLEETLQAQQSCVGTQD